MTTKEAEALRVTMSDFDHALLYDLKPAFGISDKQLDNYVLNGGSLLQMHVTVLFAHPRQQMHVSIRRARQMNLR